MLGVVLIGTIGGTAQLNRNDSSDAKTTSPASTDNTKKSPDNRELKSVTTTEADKYKLIFPILYEGRIRKTGEKHPYITTDRERVSILEEFNRVGAQGYRFIAADHNYSTAVVRLDEGRYRYDGFSTFTTTLYSKIGFYEKQPLLAAEKFQLINNSMTYGLCTSDDAAAWGEDCIYYDFFLYEKEDAAKASPEMSSFVTLGGFRRSAEGEMDAEIKQKMADGFLPVAAFSIYEIWLRKTPDPAALRAAPPEIRAIRSVRSRQHLTDKINDLARQGFRIGIITNGLALMYRHKGETAPVEYQWIGARKKKFESNLAEMAARGAVYRATYPNSYGEKETLIMEMPLTAPAKKREYKVLSFEFTVKPHGDGTLRRILTPEAEANAKTLNRLAQAGYVVRDVFYTGKVSVLMEREVN